MLLIRDEALLRKHAVATFGHQGVLDLALLGAILGNSIHEIGRYEVTCDGHVIKGRYTIYELVHSGALAVTGRRRERKHRDYQCCGVIDGGIGYICSSTNNEEQLHSMMHLSILESTKAGESTGAKVSPGNQNLPPRIYPATLAGLFPALVFKALRRKSIRPPKFQHDDSVSCTPVASTFLMETGGSMSAAATTTIHTIHERTEAICASNLHSSSDAASLFTSNGVMDADSMLITRDNVLAKLVSQRLHRVKDLPLPRELCFLGAVSLPLPPVLRVMHVAWTMDFLNTKVTSVRRLRKQLRQQQQEPVAGTVSFEDKGGLSDEKLAIAAAKLPTGGLVFRPELYAHKMRIARLARARQQHMAAKKAASMGGNALSEATSMRRGPSSTSIPEENEEEEQAKEESENISKSSRRRSTVLTVKSPSFAKPMAQYISTKNLTTSARFTIISSKTHASSSVDSSTATGGGANKPVRQDKRLMQQLLSLENKVPRIVRQWAAAARPCFAEVLLQEDRLVQEWVDRQRIQVFLGCGYNNFSSFASSVSLAQKRVIPSPISTNQNNELGLSNSSSNNNNNTRNIVQSRVTSYHTKMNVSPVSTSHSLIQHPLSATKTSFPDGVRLVASPGHGSSRGSAIYQRSRPASASLMDRLSTGQQMLSMHLWLSLLVSPLSPEYMVQDQFRCIDS
ncbi:hypothetical protein BX616_000169 [Lobosporangium transversale]|nr:hypothetical protein BX616_000169 [Lobosporangium transversale]